MTEYTIYDTNTGRALRHGKSNFPLLKAGPGESVFIGGAYGREYKIINNAPVNTGLPAAEQKAAAIEILRELRDRTRSSSSVTLTDALGNNSFTVSVDSAPEDVSALNGIAFAISQGYVTSSVEFKAAGAFYDLTLAQFSSLLGQVLASIQNAYSAERTVITKINNGDVSTEAEIISAYATALTAD